MQVWMVINTIEIVHARFNYFLMLSNPWISADCKFLPVFTMYEIFQSRYCLEQNIRSQNCQRRRASAVQRGWTGPQIFLVSEEAGDKHRAHCLGMIPLSSAREVRQRELQRVDTSLRPWPTEMVKTIKILHLNANLMYFRCKFNYLF